MDKKPPKRTSKVGYKNPPKEYQFKPGESGNPAGFKKGMKHSTTFTQELRDELATIITNNAIDTTRLRIIAKQLVDEAMTGDIKAIELVSKLNIRSVGSDIIDQILVAQKHPLIGQVTIEQLPDNWREVMIHLASVGAPEVAIKTCLGFRGKAFKMLLASSEEFRDHFDFCVDLARVYWENECTNLVISGVGNSTMLIAIMQNRYKWISPRATGGQISFDTDESNDIKVEVSFHKPDASQPSNAID